MCKRMFTGVSISPFEARFLSLLPHIVPGDVALALGCKPSTTLAMLSSLDPNADAISMNDVYDSIFWHTPQVASLLQTTLFYLENARDKELLGASMENTKRARIEDRADSKMHDVDLQMSSGIMESGRWERKTKEQQIVLLALPPFAAAERQLVLHGLTKYVNGRNNVVMGVLILSEPTFMPSEPAEKLQSIQTAMGAMPSTFDCLLG
ncbi:hypothetical protein D9619_011135 [Psilocybe cf. subviscida]|uniref:Uncharacterized protein n=1 Tax=Psilocybe cf. subviscida TaxID=2480587 RepID=A0A8H5BIR6_9AGAR|nr:hypothetical protein D9619_011135 [Psilocybe cf. subviscida]